MVSDAIPIEKMTLQKGPNGSTKFVPYKDTSGKTVLMPRAIEMRNYAIQKLREQPMPEMLLDRLVWEFGDDLAEITGRTWRAEKQPGQQFLESSLPRYQRSDNVK